MTSTSSIQLIKFLKKLHAWDKYIHNTLAYRTRRFRDDDSTRESIAANIVPLLYAFEFTTSPEGWYYWAGITTTMKIELGGFGYE